MKTNLIEITVSGRTGSGKSEVLEVVRNALIDFYGEDKIAGKNPKGAIDEAKVTRQTAKSERTILALYEQNVTGQIKIHD